MTERKQWTPETMYRDPAGKVFPPTGETDLNNPELFTEEFMSSFREMASRLQAEKQSPLFRIHWANVSSRWSDCMLDTVSPSERSFSSIADQAERIALLKDNPTGSYLFTGDGTCGKTHLLYALYRNRLEEWSRHPLAGDGCTVHLFTATSWLAGVSGHAQDPSKAAPTVTPDNIRKWARKGLPVALFIDEVCKFSMSEAKLANLFETINACYETESQVVMTSNKSTKQLIASWGGEIGYHLLRRVGAAPDGETIKFLAAEDTTNEASTEGSAA
jgi:DNA replication protein DnaC